ncbi:hypothetical protein ElyMa_005241900 [Elysia marginata]|uniref:Uncharacterized protein n=1 Tax=Elysia marginata TaxID=1093978 RepID=A0AAV4JWI7_9GAST|nr:hypothetical protein ElyMa_005241900 [Elysia marginata]
MKTTTRRRNTARCLGFFAQFILNVAQSETVTTTVVFCPPLAWASFLQDGGLLGQDKPDHRYDVSRDEWVYRVNPKRLMAFGASGMLRLRLFPGGKEEA